MASFHLPFWIYVLTEAKGKFFPCSETGAQPQLWSCLYSQLSVGDPALFLHALTCARLFRSHALSLYLEPTRVTGCSYARTRPSTSANDKQSC